MANSAISRITSKGQVTIPQVVRTSLHLLPGDRLEWRALGGGVLELRRVEEDLDALVGMLGTPPRPLTVEELDAAVARRFKADREADTDEVEGAR